MINHAGIYRGDGIIVLPKFELEPYLKVIQDFKIATLYIVPPIIIMMAHSKQLLDKYDLSSVKAIYSGAAPLGEETAKDLSRSYPSWRIRQGYGKTSHKGSREMRILKSIHRSHRDISSCLQHQW